MSEKKEIPDNLLIKTEKLCRICKQIKELRSIDPSICIECSEYYKLNKKSKDEIEHFLQENEKDILMGNLDEISEKAEYFLRLQRRITDDLGELAIIENELIGFMKKIKLKKLKVGNHKIKLLEKGFWALDHNKIKKEFKIVYEMCAEIIKHEYIEVIELLFGD